MEYFCLHNNVDISQASFTLNNPSILINCQKRQGYCTLSGTIKIREWLERGLQSNNSFKTNIYANRLPVAALRVVNDPCYS